jgi:hypothetical protein
MRSLRFRAPAQSTRARFAAQWRLHGHAVEHLDPIYRIEGVRSQVQILSPRFLNSLQIGVYPDREACLAYSLVIVSRSS